jgi:Sulfotransferase family
VTSPIHVLYVCGTGRNGSTVVSRLLGQYPGWFAAGEVRYVWERGVVDNRLCECGVAFADCPFWSKVIAEAYGDSAPREARRVVEAERQVLKSRQALRTALTPRGRAPAAELAADYATTVAAIYPAIRNVSGARVIVDSSKLPSYGAVLRTLPGVEVSVLHLVRDPRAVAYSWRRKRPLTDGAKRRLMARQSLVKSGLVWQVDNMLSRRLLDTVPGRYLQVRYEDLVASPAEEFQRIARFVGEPSAPSPVTGNTGTVRQGHAAAGNPNRFDSGSVTLQLDDAWKTQLPTRDAALVTALTWPELRQYGYPRTRCSS